MADPPCCDCDEVDVTVVVLLVGGAVGGACEVVAMTTVAEGLLT